MLSRAWICISSAAVRKVPSSFHRSIRQLQLSHIHSRRDFIFQAFYSSSSNIPLTKRGIAAGLSQEEYAGLAARTLEKLSEDFERAFENTNIEGFDIDLAEGVLTLSLGSQCTYVINRQPPNRQIWLSSPTSGPKRYNYNDGHWVDDKAGGLPLDKILEQELSDILGKRIDITDHYT